MPPQECLDQADFARQVIRVIRRDAAQLRQQFRRDPLRFGVLHAVHQAVSHGFHRREGRLRLQPVQQKSRRRAVVGGGQAAGLRFSRRIADRQIGAAHTDPIDLAGELPPQRFARVIHGETNARRAAVDRQEGFHSVRIACLRSKLQGGDTIGRQSRPGWWWTARSPHSRGPDRTCSGCRQA